MRKQVGNHKRLLICLAVTFALLIPLCSALAAEAFDFGTLFRPGYDSQVYSAYKVTVEREAVAPITATVVVIHNDTDTGVELHRDTDTVAPGPYGPYGPMTFPGYEPGTLDAGSDPVSGDISAGETKTIIFEYTPLVVYTITYWPNGATGLGSTDTGYAGSTYTIKSTGEANVGSREYYGFDGWNTKADGLGSNYLVGEPITLTKDLDLYAKWVPRI